MSKVTVPVTSKLGVKLDQPAPARDPAGQRNRDRHAVSGINKSCCPDRANKAQSLDRDAGPRSLDIEGNEPTFNTRPLIVIVAHQRL